MSSDPPVHSYIPPHLKSGVAGAAGPDARKPRDENSVRVTNLSEDTTEQDLQVGVLVAV